MKQRSRLRHLLPTLSALALVLGLLAAGPAAHARSARTTRHQYQQIWPTAVRFLRVDAGFKIVEKDVDAGYVLFEIADEGKTFSGSLELIRVEDEDGKKSVRMVINIEDRPTYIEIGLLDKLEYKLREEYGAPRQAPNPAPDEPGADKRGE